MENSKPDEENIHPLKLIFLFIFIYIATIIVTFFEEMFSMVNKAWQKFKDDDKWRKFTTKFSLGKKLPPHLEKTFEPD